METDTYNSSIVRTLHEGKYAASHVKVDQDPAIPWGRISLSQEDIP